VRQGADGRIRHRLGRPRSPPSSTGSFRRMNSPASTSRCSTACLHLPTRTARLRVERPPVPAAGRGGRWPVRVSRHRRLPDRLRAGCGIRAAVVAAFPRRPDLSLFRWRDRGDGQGPGAARRPGPRRLASPAVHACAGRSNSLSPSLLETCRAVVPARTARSTTSRSSASNGVPDRRRLVTPPWRQVFNLSVSPAPIPQVKNSRPRVETVCHAPPRTSITVAWAGSSCSRRR
jgi:hypothetical protein